jgi:hypothetical protein
MRRNKVRWDKKKKKHGCDVVPSSSGAVMIGAIAQAVSRWLPTAAARV